jgi:hypothetical protein
VTAVLRLHRGTPQCLAVTHQLVHSVGTAWDLADHPGLENLAVASGFCEAVVLQMGLTKQAGKGGIRQPALNIVAQRLVQLLPMPPGKGLQTTGAASSR